MRTLFLVFGFFIYFSSFSQNSFNTAWLNKYGGQTGTGTNIKALVEDPSGAIITAGLFTGTIDVDPSSINQQITSAGQQDIFITKHNNLGQLIWHKKIGGTSAEEPYDIELDAQGNIFISGWFKEGSTIDFDPGPSQFLVSTNCAFSAFILKLDYNGNFLWVKELESVSINTGVFALDIKIDNNQQLIIAGSFSGGNVDFDPGPGGNYLTSSGFLVSGPDNQFNDIFLLKLTNAGDFIWVKQLGAAFGSDIVQSLVITTSNEIVLTGAFTGIVDFDPSSATYFMTSAGFNPASQTHFADIFIMKLNSSGEFVFALSLGGNNTDSGLELQLTGSNEIIFTGNFSAPATFNTSQGVVLSGSSTAGSQGLFGKISTSGQLMWVKLVEGDGAVTLLPRVSANGNIFLAGYFSDSFDFDPTGGQLILSTSSGFRNALLAKYTNSGNLQWANSYGGSGDDLINEFTLSQDESTCILGGLFVSSISFSSNNQPQISTTSQAGFLAKLNSCEITQSLFNPLSDTTRVCGGNSFLDAGSGFSNYQWNTGANTQAITALAGGFYKVIVTSPNGCQASDSTYVNILNSFITNNDTTICRASQVTLNTFALSSGFAIDVDRNIYPTISIGNQIWFQRNLSVTKYRNGIVIPQITSNSAWQGPTPNSLGSGAWCWYNNDSASYNTTFGKLYNWWAVVNPNNLAPVGWHIPSNSEIQNLISFLGGGSIAGGKLKESGTSLWNSPNTGATNSSGFSARPGSVRNYFGNFENAIGRVAAFWGSDELGTAPAQFGITLSLYHDVQSTTISGIGKGSGQSVRPISDRRITYLWSTGATTSTISVTPIVTTTYYVTISDGISTCVDSVRVTIADVDTSIVVLDPPQVCSNNGQVRIQAGLASSYQWLRNGVVISGATARLYIATQTGTYRVALVNSLGCRDTSRAITVTLYPQPVSGFSISPSTQCFTGNQFSFTNTTTLPSGTLTYFWDFGNGATSTQQSPTYSYPAIGTYAVKLVATSSTGCKDSTTTNITVNASPTAGFQINNATQCLSGNNFIFTNSSSLNPGTLTYLWTFGDGNISANTNPSHTYTAAGTYTVKLVASSGLGCKDSVTRTVTVYPTPLGVLNPPSTNLLCEGGVVILTATGGTSYQWFLNGGAITGATSATLSANQPGVYTVNATSSNACTGTATGSVTLQLISKPTVNFTFTNYCASFPTQFNNQSNIANSGVVNYSWSFGQGQGTSTLQNPTYTYSSSGSYSVSLTITPVACPSLSSTVTKPITTVAPPTNQRYTTLNAVQNRDLQLQARAFGAAAYSWSPTSGLNNPSIFNPVFNFNAQVEFLITITTSIGCVVKDTQLVRIYKEKEIYVPKGFSPNGDGSNDKIFPRLVGIRTLLYFKIYDRWGQLIYQTSNENEGWDGRYRGAKQPIDTYVWMAEGIDIDNNNLKRTGTFLLLR